MNMGKTSFCCGASAAFLLSAAYEAQAGIRNSSNAYCNSLVRAKNLKTKLERSTEWSKGKSDPQNYK
jgi:hypothetical protein